MQRIAWVTPAPNTSIERTVGPIPELSRTDVLVEVAGCGVCHTDLGYYLGQVPPVAGFPLVLGHEISGRVVDTGESAKTWLGQAVIVPAVVPCEDCPACRAGRATACPNGWMPGNQGDGGFASHLVVPARGLCAVPEDRLGALSLADLSVIADAVTTPYQAIRRAGLEAGELAVVVGAGGGVGGFAVQIAAALRATVFALDVDDERLARVAHHGAAETWNVREEDPRALKQAIKATARERGLPGQGWRIFECSGTPAGQQLAFSLLNRGGSLSVVGFTPKKVELRLSNLMALDATAYGNWGCDPALYPEVLELVLEGKVVIAPFVEHRPMDQINSVFEQVHQGQVPGRVVLDPKETTS